MPYKIEKVTNGYKVGLQSGGKMSNGRYYLSNRPLTLKEAKKQSLATLNSIEEKEKTLAATLNKKYGKGTLDIKTGEFTPTK